MRKWRLKWSAGEIRDGGNLEEVEIGEDGDLLLYAKNEGRGTWVICVGPSLIFAVHRRRGQVVVVRIEESETK